MKSIVLFLSILFVLQPGFAFADYNFSTITRAFQTFLNNDLGMISGDQEDKLGDFWHLSSFGSQSVIMDPANSYKVVHVCNYNHRGEEIPVIYQDFVLDNIGNKADFFIIGYYFITHFNANLNQTENLIVNVNRDFIVVYAQTDQHKESVAFVERVRTYEVEKTRIVRVRLILKIIRIIRIVLFLPLWTMSAV